MNIDGPTTIGISALSKRTCDFRVRVSFLEPDRAHPLRWEGWKKPDHEWLARNEPGANEKTPASEKVVMWDRMTGRAASRLATVLARLPKASKIRMRVQVEDAPFQVVEDLRVTLALPKPERQPY